MRTIVVAFLYRQTHSAPLRPADELHNLLDSLPSDCRTAHCQDLIQQRQLPALLCAGPWHQSRHHEGAVCPQLKPDAHAHCVEVDGARLPCGSSTDQRHHRDPLCLQPQLCLLPVPFRLEQLFPAWRPALAWPAVG